MPLKGAGPDDETLPMNALGGGETEMDQDGEGDVTPVSGGLLHADDAEMRAAAHEALQAALGGGGNGGVRPEGVGVIDPLDAKREAAAVTAQSLLRKTRHPQTSPEKKPKLGSGGPKPVPSLQEPPIFAAPSLDTTKRALPPETYHIGEEAPPPWATALQQGIERLDKGQQEHLQALHNNNQALTSIGDKVHKLEARQDAQLERTSALESRLSALETELQDLRSRSPSIVSGGDRSPSPRGGRRQQHDDWQLVLGGWREARRDEIESEVREWFSRAECLPLLQALYCSSVRSNTCRVDLLYVQDNTQDKRKMQTACVEALKSAAQPSQIPGQGPGKLWAKRNRSPEERARIRAIVTLKDLVAKHLGPRDFEFDWRGRFWANGISILAHVDNRKPVDGALLLLDVRGEETGWWVPGALLASTLRITEQEVHEHFKVSASQ